MSTSPHQLFLLADHIKLSLLERQRAQSLNLQGNKTDGPLTRSLESLRSGIETLEARVEEGEECVSPWHAIASKKYNTNGKHSDLTPQVSKLRSQYQDLDKQFHGHTLTTATTTVTPNDPALAPDFAAAKSTPQPSRSKSVRFDKPYRDTSPDDDKRGQLFKNSNTSSQGAAAHPYTDEPPAAAPSDQADLSNEQIHTYHKSVLSEQDAQLDVLSSSIGRQRMLGIQMGDEMDVQNAMLEDVESGVDRFQGRLDVARGRLGRVARKAKGNWSWVTIGVLMLILVLLLVILN
ncbi:putative Syn8 snare [Aureobasidium subglaciale]|nr:putative Syn8 snare [Aureobasidium subglaciale]